MPLYEYECTTCHRRTEKIQKFSDLELTVCPHCAGKLERTITAAAVSFKGGGWFKDGYGSAKPTAAASGDTPSAAPSDNTGGSTPSSDSASTSDNAKPAPAAAAPSTPTPAASPSTKP